MMRVSHDPPAFACLDCGQKFHPIRLSLADALQMTKTAQARDAQEQAAFKDRAEQHFERKLWTPKTYTPVSGEA